MVFYLLYTNNVLIYMGGFGKDFDSLCFDYNKV